MQTAFSYPAINNTYNSEGSFDHYMELLVNFVQQNENYPGYEQHPQLYRWIELQRMKIRNGTLSPASLKKLKSINFIWQKRLVNWDRQFAALKQKIQGNTNPAFDKSYHWLKRQVTICKQTKLIAYGAERMVEIMHPDKQNDQVLSVKWQTLLQEVKQVYEALQTLEGHTSMLLPNAASNKAYEKFKDKFEVLKEYFKLYGKYPSASENKDLYCWMSLQRSKRNSGKLPDLMILQLDSINFPWSLNESNWEKHYSLAEEMALNGKKINKSNQEIFSWVTRQIDCLNSGSLSTDRQNKMEKLLQEAPYLTEKNTTAKASWSERFDNVREYITTHQSLPSIFHNSIYSSYHNSLKTWLQIQVKNYMKLDALKKDMLDSLELHKYTRKSWAQMFAEVEAYVLAHKRLPSKKSNIELHSWIKKQRPYFDKENRHMERYRLLKKLKISFKTIRKKERVNNSVHDAKWHKKLSQLIEFREKNKNCWPTIYTDSVEERKIASWVLAQKQAFKGTNGYKRRSISPERVKQLDAIGFEWPVIVK